MFIEEQKKWNVIICFCILILMSSLENKVIARADYSKRDPHRPSEESGEVMTLQALGLSEDTNDTEILRLLDVSDKRIFAISLVESRRIIAGIPKLIKIFDNNALTISERVTAAEALCTLGDNSWLSTIKAMATDPNSKLNRMSLQYDAAGLLARAGDYSQFDVVVKGLSDEKDFIRHKAMFELSKFAHPTDPVTDRAAELLTNFAKSEPNLRFREYAIEGLEQLAKVKPVLKQKVVEALEANANSSDKNLKTSCKVKLKAYKKPAEPNQ
jgi:hypothetical protein